jgi:hypothetical protein
MNTNKEQDEEGERIAQMLASMTAISSLILELLIAKGFVLRAEALERLYELHKQAVQHKGSGASVGPISHLISILEAHNL